MAIYIRDQTEHLSRQDAQYREEEVRFSNMQNITSTVSHEMRTPLGTIQQFVMLLMTLGPSAVDRKQAKHFLHLIKYQVSMLLGYVNDLLDLKQIN